MLVMSGDPPATEMVVVPGARPWRVAEPGTTSATFGWEDSKRGGIEAGAAEGSGGAERCHLVAAGAVAGLGSGVPAEGVELIVVHGDEHAPRRGDVHLHRGEGGESAPRHLQRRVARAARVRDVERDRVRLLHRRIIQVPLPVHRHLRDLVRVEVRQPHRRGSGHEAVRPVREHRHHAAGGRDLLSVKESGVEELPLGQVRVDAHPNGHDHLYLAELSGPERVRLHDTVLHERVGADVDKVDHEAAHRGGVHPGDHVVADREVDLQQRHRRAHQRGGRHARARARDGEHQPSDLLLVHHRLVVAVVHGEAHQVEQLRVVRHLHQPGGERVAARVRRDPRREGAAPEGARLWEGDDTPGPEHLRRGLVALERDERRVRGHHHGGRGRVVRANLHLHAHVEDHAEPVAQGGGGDDDTVRHAGGLIGGGARGRHRLRGGHVEKLHLHRQARRQHLGLVRGVGELVHHRHRRVVDEQLPGADHHTHRCHRPARRHKLPAQPALEEGQPGQTAARAPVPPEEHLHRARGPRELVEKRLEGPGEARVAE
eukprot:920684-Prorocentrum_minimum.AAC.3